MDDADRLLSRREGFAAPRPGLPSPGAPAFLGQVASSGTNLAVGKFMLVNPVEITGSEAEGATPSYATDTTRTVPVYVVSGPPAAGARVICRRVDHRWVAATPPAGCTGTICAQITRVSSVWMSCATHPAYTSILVQLLGTGGQSNFADSSGLRCFSAITAGVSWTVRTSITLFGTTYVGDSSVVPLACGESLSISVPEPVTHDCSCKTPPTPIAVTLSYSGGRDQAYYGNAYQPCSIAWYCGGSDLPPYLSSASPGYYSTTGWTGDDGWENHFRLDCASTQWQLSHWQRNGGSWSSNGTVYQWSIGASPNSCSPFNLATGSSPGSFFVDKFLASG